MMIDRAMVLAAGLGKRMRPLTDTLPKPLVQVAGKALIDHVLDKLADAGVMQAVVNVHHRADQIEAHLKSRTRPRIVISDERGELLDTGGGVVKALPHLGSGPFFHMNSDTLWLEGVTPNLSRLAEQFDRKIQREPDDAEGDDGRQHHHRVQQAGGKHDLHPVHGDEHEGREQQSPAEEHARIAAVEGAEPEVRVFDPLNDATGNAEGQCDSRHRCLCCSRWSH
jgi:hypothetical protein